MSPKSKFYWILITTLVVGWSLIALWAITDRDIFVGLLLGWVFIGSALVRSVKCPDCGVPVSFQGKVGTFSVHGPLARGGCRNCGYCLTAPIHKAAAEQ